MSLFKKFEVSDNFSNFSKTLATPKRKPSANFSSFSRFSRLMDMLGEVYEELHNTLIPGSVKWGFNNREDLTHTVRKIEKLIDRFILEANTIEFKRHLPLLKSAYISMSKAYEEYVDEYGTPC